MDNPIAEGVPFFLFSGLPASRQARLLAQAAPQERLYEKGETIYDSRLAQRALALVLEGEVRVLHGRVVMNDLHPGDVFGAAALFGEDEPYPSRVVAVSRCRVALFTQATVSALMAADPRIAENYIRFLSGRIRFLNRRLSALTAGQTDGRLWRFLRTHCDAQGRVCLPGGMKELAEALGMGRTSLYRALDGLVADGRIRRNGKEILVLNREEE